MSLVQDSFRDDLLDRDAPIALVIHPRNGQNDRELSIVKGEYLEVIGYIRIVELKGSSLHWLPTVDTNWSQTYQPISLSLSLSLSLSFIVQNFLHTVVNVMIFKIFA
jgi:hypothetical protein